MEVLVLGGTRLFGIHMVNSLISKGHNVTIATRGKATDPFGSNVERLIIERTNPNSIMNVLGELYFDVVCDNLAYCSNDVQFLLNSINCKKYIMTSSASVYINQHLCTKEKEFDPLSYTLNWCNRQEHPYAENKRQAECALFQEFPQYPGTAVRFPYVVGEDDYTKRLHFYVENIVKGNPIYVDNLSEKFSFIKSTEAGDFIAWLSENSFVGAINGNSGGEISIDEIIKYVEKRTGKKAILSSEGLEGPYNGQVTFSLDNELANKLGYYFSNLNDWIYDLLDTYIYFLKKA